MLFENNPNPMFIVDGRTNNILDANRAAIQVYGYEYEEFLSMTIMDMRPEDDISELLDMLEAKKDEKVRDYGIWRHVTKDKSELYVHVNAQVIEYKGIPARLVAVNNVTELIKTEKELKKAYQELDFHTNNSPLAFVEWDEKFNVRRWSDKTSEIFGWSREEVLGKNPVKLNFIYEEDVRHVISKIRAIVKGKLPNFTLQNRNYTKDGRVVYCEWYNSGLFSESGKLISILSQVQDITKNKEDEKELRHEKNFVSNIINGLPGIFYLFDEKGKLIRWNQNFLDVTGYSKKEAERLNALKYFEGEDRKLIAEGIAKVFEKGRAVIEARLSTKDGTKIPYLFNAFGFRQNGQEYVLGTGFDMSERLEAVRQMEDAKNLLEKTFNSLNEAVLILEPPEMNVIGCNPATERIFGFSADDLRGRSMSMLHVDMESREYFHNVIIETLKKGKIFRSDYRLKRKDGEIIFTDHTVTPLNENGSWRDGVVMVIRDITEKKLSEKELRIKDSAIKSALNAIVLYDLNGRITYANPSFIKMWGFDSNDSAIDADFKTLWQNGDYQSIASLLQKQDKWSGKLQGMKKDNVVFPVRLSISKVTDEMGSPICMMASMEDISDRESTRRKLEESQRTLSTLMENLPGMAYRCKNDRNWTMHFVSGGCLELTGYTPQELIESDTITFSDIIVPEDRDRIYEEVQQALEEQKAFQLSYRIITKGGELKWVWEKGSEVHTNDGECFLEGFITDITERVEITEELKKQAELFSRIFENSPVGIAMVDENNHIRMVNSGFENMFHYSSEEVLGKELDKLIVPKHLRKDADNFFKNNDKSYVRKETIRLAKGNKEVSVLVYGVPVYFENKQIADFGIYVDITDRKEAEEKVLQSLKEKEVLLAEIHHRVKNNLAIVSGLLELQANTMDSPETKSFLQESQTRIKSIAMIHEKLYHSETLSNIEFDEYIDSLAKSIDHLYKNVNKDINVVTNAKKVLFNINQAIPCALLLNEVLVNSYKHAFTGRKKGKILVELMQHQDKVVLTVRDDGVGLPEKFDLKKSKSLGMTLITTLSKQLNARLKMYNDNGVVTSVAFKLDS